ncbi:DNA repair protein RadA [Novosphingobium sp. 1949]|uniref:DNA repair protein RadA n=1 Tax=Novosphingobium organovorum TaxID=2930092 RepID=A0ABT0BA13_9SPHN|nr:DNA repair protein RadA [Novosphingobium organovorum]MCJ2181896.1 DNA repair protein RadA [Novosphingobium organovorum]
MAKPKRRYVCQACGAIASRWQGQCADCGEWNTLTEEAPQTVFSSKHDLSSGGRPIIFTPLDAPGELPVRRASGLAEFDRALGGGLVPGSAILMGGDPGIGKSTLLLQVAAHIAMAGARPPGSGSAVYVSGEEAAGQVRLRAERLGVSKAPIQMASSTSVRDILTTLGAMEPPALLVIDSIQTMHSDQIEGAPGTVSQVRGCAFELIRYAKENGVTLILVGHVTKDGSIAGPRVLEHMVDVVMAFEGERSHQYRILRSLKNRFGPVDEIGVFAMEGAGLAEVGNPSMLFLSGREEPMAGSAVFPAMEGTRPVLIEIQALIVRLQSGATPRRAVVGWDNGRMAMLLAVLEARCGLNFSSAEVYLNVAGGYRLSDPAADLAVAAALVSALGDKPLSSSAVWFGEVSLAGEIRPVAHSSIRQRESAKLGFAKAFGPAQGREGAGKGGEPGEKGLSFTGLSMLPNLVDRILSDA